MTQQEWWFCVKISSTLKIMAQNCIKNISLSNPWGVWGVLSTRLHLSHLGSSVKVLQRLWLSYDSVWAYGGVGTMCRLYIPLQRSGSWLRGEVLLSTVMLNVWAHGTLKIAKEYLARCASAKNALLFHFISHTVLISPSVQSALILKRSLYRQTFPP